MRPASTLKFVTGMQAPALAVTACFSLPEALRAARRLAESPAGVAYIVAWRKSGQAHKSTWLVHSPDMPRAPEYIAVGAVGVPEVHAATGIIGYIRAGMIEEA
jgi:hypothetical protein